MATMNELSPGMRCTLNSGSPPLTVTEMRQGGELVAVAWFAEPIGMPQEAVFPIACVKKLDDA